MNTSGRNYLTIRSASGSRGGTVILGRGSNEIVSDDLLTTNKPFYARAVSSVIRAGNIVAPVKLRRRKMFLCRRVDGVVVLALGELQSAGRSALDDACQV